MRVEIDRLDAHAGDHYGRQLQIEVPDQLLLSELLAQVLQPFLEHAPLTTWVCRARSSEGWQNVAQVVTFSRREQLGARLLISDVSLRSFVGVSEHVMEIGCHPSV